LDRVILLVDAAARLPFAAKVKPTRERIVDFAAKWIERGGEQRMVRRIGIHAVHEALASGQPIDGVIVARGLHGERVQEIVDLARRRGIPVRFENREQLDRMAEDERHQGVIALAAPKAPLAIEDLLARAKTPGLVVLLDGIEDPRNLGAIIRTALAAGADGLVIPERRAAGLTETVARTSAGAIEHLPVARVKNLRARWKN